MENISLYIFLSCCALFI